MRVDVISPEEFIGEVYRFVVLSLPANGANLGDRGHQLTSWTGWRAGREVFLH